MAYIKLKELIKSLPISVRRNEFLENIAGNIFNCGMESLYVHSAGPPTERYGIEVHEKYVELDNDIIHDFRSYGPNERYLINLILHSKDPLLYIVGGIGVGKTRFCHFLIQDVLPKLGCPQNHNVPHACITYYDFLFETDSISEGDKTVEEIFKITFCNRLEYELDQLNMLKLDDEVTTVWESIKIENKESIRINPALSFIASRLREEDAGSEALKLRKLETVIKRKNIRKELISDSSRRFIYFALLFKHFQMKFYAGCQGFLIIIVDNVDHMAPMVQFKIKTLLKKFALLSNVRTILTVRQTTYYQQISDDVSIVAQKAAFCGPTPMQVIISRIIHFLKNPIGYAGFYPEDELQVLIRSLENLTENFLQSQVFEKYFSSLCGRSIRKAFIIARNLINNSVYDLSKIDWEDKSNFGINTNDILRALLVGKENTFTWTPDGVIENIFQVIQEPKENNFLKLRILRAIRNEGDEGITIKRLISILSSFLYDDETICQAINELKHKRKRLIWSDSVRDVFQGFADLCQHSSSRLRLSTVGEGYIDILFSDIQYIQETMLDTQVNEDFFGTVWDYSKMKDRIALVRKFIDYLFHKEVLEIECFVNSAKPEEYEKAFGNYKLLTEYIYISVKDILRKIIDIAIDKEVDLQKKAYLSEVREKNMTEYDERINMINYYRRLYLEKGN